MIRLFPVAAGILACALAGCSGSGGTANAVSPPTAATPTPTPTPTAAPDPHPVVDGAAVTFAVDTTTVDTPAGAQPTTSAQSATVTETIHTGVTFNGHSATDVRITSSDGNFTTDNYEGYVPTPSGQSYALFGQTSSYVKQLKTETFVFPDLRVIDEVPEVTGATWNISIAETMTISQGPPSKHVDESDVVHADGSEVDTITHSDGNSADTYVDTYTTNANGTASIVDNTPAAGFRFSIGVPVQQGGVFVIPVTNTDASGTQSYTVPDWYPGHALPTAPFTTITNADLGVQLPPPACSKGPQIPATHIRTSTSYLALFGYVVTQTEDSYFTPSRGLICYTLGRTTVAYDYGGTGAVIDTRTENDAFALTSGIGVLSDRRGLSSVAAAYPFLHHHPRMTRDNPLPPRAPTHR